MVTDNDSLLRWIPALPLLVAAFHTLWMALARRNLSNRSAAGISLAGVVGSLGLSVVALQRVAETGAQPALRDRVYGWIDSGSLSVDIAFWIDPLSAVLCLVVTSIAALIYVYAWASDRSDFPEANAAGRSGIGEANASQRFYCCLDFLVAGSLLAILADNLLLFFLGWQVLGLASYLVIGLAPEAHGSERVDRSGVTSFAFQRLGDVGFLLAFFLLFWALVEHGAATASFSELPEAFAMLEKPSAEALPGAFGLSFANLIGLCFLLAILAKGALFPFHMWLARVARAPVAAAALVHSATVLMVAVYLVCRLDFLFASAPVASALMAWLGLLSALVGAFLAWRESDLRIALSHSTLSQIGLIFVALGCGAFEPAAAHLLSHGAAKALLFLGAGSVIVAMQGQSRATEMGGLRRRIPRTHALFAVGGLALLGVPLLAGFASRESLLSGILRSDLPGAAALHGLATCVVLLTAIYLTRLYLLVFAGESRADANLRSKIREPNGWVLATLSALVASLFLGGVLVSHYALWNLDEGIGMDAFLGTAFQSAPAQGTLRSQRLFAVSNLSLTALGIAVAYGLHALRPASWVGGLLRLQERASPVFAALDRKFYVQDAYRALLFRPLLGFSRIVLDGAFEQRLFHWVGGQGFARGLRVFAERMFRPLHSGLGQHHLIWLVGGASAAVAYLVWVR